MEPDGLEECLAQKQAEIISEISVGYFIQRNLHGDLTIKSLFSNNPILLIKISSQMQKMHGKF